MKDTNKMSSEELYVYLVELFSLFKETNEFKPDTTLRDIKGGFIHFVKDTLPLPVKDMSKKAQKTQKKLVQDHVKVVLSIQYLFFYDNLKDDYVLNFDQCNAPFSKITCKK